MENLGIDENTRNTGGGIIQGTRETLPFFINPSTGELLVEIIPTAVAGTIINRNILNIDENNRNVGGGVTDDANEDIIPLTTVDHVDLPCLRIEI
jgi:hypothetical protein